MLNMKPIPINCKTTATTNTVSPNGKHTACINKTILVPKITIIDNDKVYFANKKTEHFQHNFFDTTKIYALQFNNSSDKLYCLAKKKQQSKLYQFSLIEAKDKSKSNTWQKQSSIPIASEAKYFSIDETNQDLMVVSFKNNELCCNSIDIKSSLITYNHYLPPTKEKIIDVKFDATNRIIYAYLENKSLVILGKTDETDKKWEIKHCLNNCPSLPHCYSRDGNTLVFINDSKLQIRCLSSENTDKIVKEISYDNVYKTKYKLTTIKDICINPQGDEVTTLISLSKGENLTPYSLISKINKRQSTWLMGIDNPFYLFASNSLANNYYGKTVSYYVDSTNTKVLVESNNIHFYFGAPKAELRITNNERLKEINDIIRKENRRRYEYRLKMEAAEKQSSSSSNSNSLFQSMTNPYCDTYTSCHHNSYGFESSCSTFNTFNTSDCCD